MAAAAQMLVCLPDSAEGCVVREYAHYLRGVLGGRICYEPMLCKEDVDCIRQASTNYAKRTSTVSGRRQPIVI
jgi:hypothetical protein